MGKAIHFPENQIREMGRTARGIRGIKILKEDNPIDCIKRLYDLNGLRFIARKFPVSFLALSEVHQNLLIMDGEP
jgi:DNA gyrase/topoisomerase IV subunit A